MKCICICLCVRSEPKNRDKRGEGISSLCCIPDPHKREQGSTLVISLLRRSFHFVAERLSPSLLSRQFIFVTFSIFACVKQERKRIEERRQGMKVVRLTHLLAFYLFSFVRTQPKKRLREGENLLPTYSLQSTRIEEGTEHETEGNRERIIGFKPAQGERERERERESPPFTTNVTLPPSLSPSSICFLVLAHLCVHFSRFLKDPRRKIISAR